MSDTDLATMAATDLAGPDKQVSPIEAIDSSIHRMEMRNPSVNAFVYLAFDEARERARTAEQ
jgi:amidase